MPAKAIFTSPKWRINEFASSVKNEFKGAEIFWMLQTAYGDAVMSRRRVFEWYKRFKEGREETADNERSGRPSTSTTPEKVDKVLELVHEDRRITVREVAEEAGISFGSTKSIMKDKTAGASWILHHDNAPAHTALKILKFLQDHSTSEFPQTPQSRFGPLRLFHFWKAPKKVKGSEISEQRRDQSGIEEGHEGDPENRLPEVFCRLEKKVVEVHRGQRDYFEGDNLKILYNNKLLPSQKAIPRILQAMIHEEKKRKEAVTRNSSVLNFGPPSSGLRVSIFRKGSSKRRGLGLKEGLLKRRLLEAPCHDHWPAYLADEFRGQTSAILCFHICKLL
ncbi:hypothetical protein LAZ67_12000515, partial [Cordylochernes scorpioides]